MLLSQGRLWWVRVYTMRTMGVTPGWVCKPGLGLIPRYGVMCSQMACKVSREPVAVSTHTLGMVVPNEGCAWERGLWGPMARAPCVYRGLSRGMCARVSVARCTGPAAAICPSASGHTRVGCVIGRSWPLGPHGQRIRACACGTQAISASRMMDSSDMVTGRPALTASHTLALFSSTPHMAMSKDVSPLA